jgi:hypothetical protein
MKAHYQGLFKGYVLDGYVSRVSVHFAPLDRHQLAKPFPLAAGDSQGQGSQRWIRVLDGVFNSGKH